MPITSQHVHGLYELYHSQLPQPPVGPLLQALERGAPGAFTLVPLHSGLNPSDMKRAFERPRQGTRKVPVMCSERLMLPRRVLGLYGMGPCMCAGHHFYQHCRDFLDH